MTRVLIAGNWVDSDLIERIAKALKQKTDDIISILQNNYKEAKTLIGHESPHFILEIPELPEFISTYDDDLNSYVPRFGVFCKYLWVDPKVIHDLACVLIGFIVIFFHRKCFMKLKTFKNLRF